ncbi:hypothetical protein GUJ93_ZPchr0012g21059 [Zizania palustris]|uniref:Uncharacterized protein n=1 Tax=Zizania palustris TaxID=103762 RepID=A0A8J5WRY8_ZIZPA|nr:hypothetical protein GUJ93_ZPchr0012g21059 [Zizania palustris]
MSHLSHGVAGLTTPNGRYEEEVRFKRAVAVRRCADGGGRRGTGWSCGGSALAEGGGGGNVGHRAEGRRVIMPCRW